MWHKQTVMCLHVSLMKVKQYWIVLSGFLNRDLPPSEETLCFCYVNRLVSSRWMCLKLKPRFSSENMSHGKFSWHTLFLLRTGCVSAASLTLKSQYSPLYHVPLLFDETLKIGKLSDKKREMEKSTCEQTITVGTHAVKQTTSIIYLKLQKNDTWGYLHSFRIITVSASAVKTF